MYLAKTLRDFDGTVYDMVGVIPAETAMSRTQMTLGYRELTVTRRRSLGEQRMRIRGHEFHYSTLHPKGYLEYLGQLTDAQGSDRGRDGITVGTVTALYTHLHFSSHPHLPLALIEAARGKSATRGDVL
jgi:cobyrinic acid a,c-diamide synthase